MRMSVCMYVCPSVCLSVCLYVCLSVCLALRQMRRCSNLIWIHDVARCTWGGVAKHTFVIGQPGTRCATSRVSGMFPIVPMDVSVSLVSCASESSSYRRFRMNAFPFSSWSASENVRLEKFLFTADKLEAHNLKVQSVCSHVVNCNFQILKLTAVNFQ